MIVNGYGGFAGAWEDWCSKTFPGDAIGQAELKIVLSQGKLDDAKALIELATSSPGDARNGDAS